MKRYQVYLNPNTVSVLDEFEKYTSVSRSKLIREAIDRLALNLAKTFAAQKIAPNDKFILDSLIGQINISSLEQTNYALKDDSSYLID